MCRPFFDVSAARPGRTAVLVSVAALAAAGSAAAQLQPIVGPPQRIDVNGGTEAANETTAAASRTFPNSIIAGWNDWRLSGGSEVINAGFAISNDGGTTWNDFLLRPPAPNQSGVEGDPMTAYDDRTGTLFGGAISFSAGSNSGIYVARKPPGSPGFEPSVMARTASFTDKCWMAAGPRPGLPSTTRLYVGYNEGLIWSDDLGSTWTNPSSLGGGIGFLPRLGPGGELYVAYWDFGSGMRLKRSFDGGQTTDDRLIATRMDVWGTQDGSRAPGTFRLPSLGSLAVSPVDGSLSYVYYDTTMTGGGQFDLDLYFTRSTDQGTSWTTPQIIADDPPGATFADQIFPWLEADRFGRLHLLWLDTRHDVRPDGGENGIYDGYYAWSINDGASWELTRLSPASFNSTNDGLNRPSQFLGDYLGLAVARDAVYPVYPDTSNGDPDTITHRILLPIPGDVDGDGSIGFADLVEVLAAWGPCPGPGPCPADVDGDGIIGLNDILFILSRYGS